MPKAGPVQLANRVPFLELIIQPNEALCPLTDPSEAITTWSVEMAINN